jgi:hypothetical protein
MSNTRIRAERIAAGLCRDCGKEPPIQGRMVCGWCANKRLLCSKRRLKKCTSNKVCHRCGEINSRGKTLCNSCTEKSVQSFRERRRYNKQFVINYFGGKCAVCGETDLIVLSLDHVNNDGFLDKKSASGKKQITPTWYAKLVKAIKADQPLPRQLQVLCFNDHARKDLQSWEG